MHVLTQTIAQLKHDNASLAAQLKQPRQVILQQKPQKIIHTTTTPEVENELKAIRELLLGCEMSKFQVAEQELRELLLERNRIKGQLTSQFQDEGTEVENEVATSLERNANLE